MKLRPGAQRVRNCLGIVVTVGAAVSCAPVPDRANTVAFYREHKDERLAALAQCANDPGTAGRTAQCANAREAERLESIGSQRDLPSLDLPTKRKPGS